MGQKREGGKKKVTFIYVFFKKFICFVLEWES